MPSALSVVLNVELSRHARVSPFDVLFSCRDVDKVHDLMDEVQEQQEIASEISEAISNPVAFGTDVDEDELLEELETLEQQELDEKLIDVAGPAAEDLPEVPTAEPSKTPAAPSKPAKAHEEDPEMLELAKWAS
ncbi:hypothetical protein V5799_014038 [Amblyomma americanum]|uniref:Uncharacterized protein n=1 Tax=Amblyomma americanum TaxID=6943 RepID=A0AAQ4E469_AMBAM